MNAPSRLAQVSSPYVMFSIEPVITDPKSSARVGVEKPFVSK
jgi:hypothetical protein